ncbi:hypothetical protein MTO96_030257 [Rhipicephalus appendiculatus]
MAQWEAHFYWQSKVWQAEATKSVAWWPPHGELSLTTSRATSEGPMRPGRIAQEILVQQELVQEVPRACFNESTAAVPWKTFSYMRVERTGSAAAVRHRLKTRRS